MPKKEKFLRYLAAGNTFSDLHYSFRMDIKTISCIVQEVCEALWETLSPIDMANNLETNENFRHCLGTIDGKHIRIIKPEESGSMFFNYKPYFSIVLMTVVDTNYNFVFIDVGVYGNECDSVVFKETEFWKIVDDQLNIPRPKQLTGAERKISIIVSRERDAT